MTGFISIAAPPSGGSSTKNTPSNTTSVTSVDPKIAIYLENIDSWDYDILALERVTMRKWVSVLLFVFREILVIRLLFCNV